MLKRHQNKRMNQKMSDKKRFLIVVIPLFFSMLPVFAEKIIFSANRMTGQAGNTNTTTSLSGDAYIKTETMEIQADDVELSGDNYRYIKATGHIAGKNLKTNMEFTCDSLEYDRTTKLASLKGNVNLEDKDNDVKANAQIIDYNQDTEIAVLQVQIKLTQKDNVCSGSYAVYYKEAQLLEISGNAQVQQDDDIFRAQHITLNLDTQDITLGGNVKGTVKDTKSVESEPEAEAGAEPDNSEEEQVEKVKGEESDGE